MFHRRVADMVARRCGRFFKTNGVEFFAWPLAAALATRTVFLDAPLSITGRTAFTYCNLMAEGMLMAKRFFPEELDRYDFDEQKYLRETRAELKLREDLGVDVTEVMDELAKPAIASARSGFPPELGGAEQKLSAHEPLGTAAPIADS